MSEQQKSKSANDVKRCAIYARYSSDQQRETSVEDQIFNCREYARKQGWIVEEKYVQADQAISGTSMAGRDGLTTLVNAAKQRPRPFDVLLIDDTSRLARNLAQALIVIKGLRFCDVRVIAISQGLDSDNPSAQQLFTLYGMMDEQFIQGLADKVRRGQSGRVRIHVRQYGPADRDHSAVFVPVRDHVHERLYLRCRVESDWLYGS